MSEIPIVSGQSLIAFDFLHGPTYEAVFVPGDDEAENEAVREVARSTFLPRVLWLEATDPLRSSPSLSVLFAERDSVDGEPTLYLCEKGRCELPLRGLDAITDRLEQELF